jgi:hypothetical protein
VNRKIPWRLSKFQKARQRKRLRAVDTVVAVVDQALAKQGIQIKPVQRWKEEMPIEQEMVPKDKYTLFDRKEKKYRKAIHSTSIGSDLQRFMARGEKTSADHICRAAEMDENLSACQPTRILSYSQSVTGARRKTLQHVLYEKSEGVQDLAWQAFGSMVYVEISSPQHNKISMVLLQEISVGAYSPFLNSVICIQ